jgi:hypothetical protein
MMRTIVEGEDTEQAAVRASLVEIGEGGVLVSCDSGLPDVGALVELSFTLEDRAITTQGEVLRHDVPSTGRPCAAVRFLDPTAHGDHIRRVAFAVQRAMARARLG